MSERDQKAESKSEAAAPAIMDDMRSFAGPSQAAIQRKLMQRKAARNAVAQAKDAMSAESGGESVASSGGGSPMAENVRKPMESSFGADFSDVRVHQGGEAQAMGATAYAQGTDLHFAPGAYDPGSKSGKELLGHELTHVVQQREGRVETPQGKDSPINSDPGLEAEADSLGERAAAGEQVRVSGATSSSMPSNAPVQAKLNWTSEKLKSQGVVKRFLIPDKTGGGKKYEEILGLLDKYNNHPVIDITPWDEELTGLCRDIAAACSRYLNEHRGGDAKEAARIAAVTALHVAAIAESMTTRPSFGPPKKGGHDHDQHADGGHAKVASSDAKVEATPTPPPPLPAQKDDAPAHDVDAKAPADVSSPPPPTPSVSSLRSQLEGKIGLPGAAPKPPGRPSAPVADSKEAEISSAPQLGGLMPQMASGEGTFAVKAIIAAQDAVERGAIKDEALAAVAAHFVHAIEDHLGDVELDESFEWNKYFSVKERVQLIEIVSAIASADIAKLRAVFDMPAVVEEEEHEAEHEEAPTPPSESKTPKPPTTKPPYIVRQRAKLHAIDAKIAAMGNSITTKATADRHQTIRTVESYGKLGVKTAASTALGLVPGAGNVFNVAMAVKSARSSHEHAKKIRKIRNDMVSSGRRDAKDPLTESADYAAGQKDTKRNKAGFDAVASAVPVAGTVAKGVKTAGYKAKGILKWARGTRGVERTANARTILTEARDIDPVKHEDARLMILELFNDSENEYLAVMKGDFEGAVKMIAAKLKSG